MAVSIMPRFPHASSLSSDVGWGCEMGKNGQVAVNRFCARIRQI